MGSLRTFTAGVVTGLFAAAIGQELQKPADERTWKGTVAGVPYNFRIAEWRDIAREYWNPDSTEILSPHAIGLGWGINFAAVASCIRQFADSWEQPEAARATERDESTHPA